MHKNDKVDLKSEVAKAVEEAASSKSPVPGASITVSGSQGVIVGNNNQQSVSQVTHTNWDEAQTQRLSAELAQLFEKLKELAQDPEHYEALAAVGHAQKELAQGQTQSARQRLKNLGGWGVQIARSLPLAELLKLLGG